VSEPSPPAPAAARVNEVPAGRGLAWLGEAFELFRRAPMTWIAMCSGWIVIWFALLILPFLGPVLANLLQPVFFGSFAIAAYKQSAGEPLTMADLFSGFRRNVRALINIGFLMMLAQLASAFLMRALGLPTWPDDESFEVVAYVEQLRPHLWILAAGFLLMALASGALWFAPQLIVFHGMSTSHAIRWSVYAALSNLGALSLYGAVLTLALVFAWLPFGLGLLVMVPILVISTYTGYRDIFEAKVTPP
jgi:hypothetical protein